MDEDNQSTKLTNEEYERILGTLNEIDDNIDYRLQKIERALGLKIEGLELSVAQNLKDFKIDSHVAEAGRLLNLFKQERNAMIGEFKGIYKDYVNKLESKFAKTYDKLFADTNIGPSILIDRKVEAIFINSDKTVIKLQTDNGFIDLRAVGDCCSDCWFENTDNIDDLIGSTIKAFEEVELDEVMAPTTQESDTLYSFRILHQKRYNHITTLEFRNSSNGYYGGYIVVEGADNDLSGFKQLDGDI